MTSLLANFDQCFIYQRFNYKYWLFIATCLIFFGEHIPANSEGIVENAGSVNARSVLSANMTSWSAENVSEIMHSWSDSPKPDENTWYVSLLKINTTLLTDHYIKQYFSLSLWMSSEAVDYKTIFEL